MNSPPTADVQLPPEPMENISASSLFSRLDWVLSVPHCGLYFYENRREERAPFSLGTERDLYIPKKALLPPAWASSLVGARPQHTPARPHGGPSSPITHPLASTLCLVTTGFFIPATSASTKIPGLQSTCMFPLLTPVSSHHPPPASEILCCTCQAAQPVLSKISACLSLLCNRTLHPLLQLKPEETPSPAALSSGGLLFLHAPQTTGLCSMLPFPGPSSS